MNGFSENSLTGISPESTKAFHDLALMWMKANIDAGTLSPEELYLEYRRIYEKISDTDEAAQKKSGISPW
ncbi:MAG: hypothetical protein WCG21_12185 [Eubacteriales bacterium]